MKRTTIELPDHLHTKLKVMAAERDRSMNSLLVEAVESLLEREREHKSE